MITLQQFEELKREVEEASREQAKAQGAAEQLLKEILAQSGCKTLKEAEKYLKAEKEKLGKEKTAFDKEFSAFERTYRREQPE